jgi:hypothetical protein
MFIKSVLSGTQQGAKVFDAEYLVIAGGGGGGCDGAGGGAGGYRSSVTGESSGGGASAEATFTASFNTAYTVTVGAGGAGSTTTSVKGTSGTDTVFNTVTSAGGGGGASRDAIDGLTGGSGGGAGGIPGGSVGAGTANQGFAGGLAYNGGLASGYGGGGGADQVGQNAGASLGGDGGDGVESYSTGSSVYRAGGGGGGHGDGSPPGGIGGTGGLGGGGNGSSLNVLATAGTANTGGGGGGGGRQGGYVNGAAGGSGVVILRVPNTVTADFSAGVVYNYIPVDGFHVYEVTAAGVSDTVTFIDNGPDAVTINDSLRFNDDDSAYLSRTPASAGNRKTWTWAGWVKRGNLGTSQLIFFVDRTGSNNEGVVIAFNSSNEFSFYQWNGSSYDYRLRTNAVYRDSSAWYHIVCVLDTTNATASERQKLYINGIAVNSFGVRDNPSLNFDGLMSDTKDHYFSRTTNLFDGYLSDVYFIDGEALDPSYFGRMSSDGIWEPIAYAGTSYGTNGFHLDFADNSTAAALGTDVSGNSNDWTPSGITTDDQVSDTPTVNYATLNPLNKLIVIGAGASPTFSDGNLNVNGNNQDTVGTFGVSSGKWYYEVTQQDSGAFTNGVGWYRDGTSEESLYRDDGAFRFNGTETAYGASWQSSGDIIGIALDLDNTTISFYKNGVSQGSAKTNLASGTYIPLIYCRLPSNLTANFGQRPFTYTPPAGFVALNSANLPAPVIADGKEHFGTVLWNATGTQSVQGLEFQPDFLWLKVRSTSGSHHLMDAVRGAANFLQSDTTDAETNSPTFLTSFDSSGFSFGSNNWSDGRSMVGWNWNAGGSTVTNTDGTITSQVRANTDAGFSIVGYTGTGSVATVGHGLDSAPEMVIVKSRDDGSARWVVWHTGLSGGTYDLGLNNTDAEVSNASRFNGLPTSTIFNIGTGGLVNDTENYIAYCFHSVDGFSKFGSYTGNGSTDGPFVYTGFRPAFVMVKRTDVANDWDIRDTSRNPYNIGDKILFPNRSDAETTNAALHIDINSNGFKVRGTGNQNNASGGTYIYMAFAENPFKTARAR